MATGGFRGVNNLPHLLKRVGEGHFAEGVGSGLHRTDAHRGVQRPRGGDEHGVRSGLGKHLLPSVLITKIHFRAVAVLGDVALRALGCVLPHIANPDKIHPLEGRELGGMARSPSPHANDGDLDLIEFWGCDVAHVLGSGRAGGSGGLGTGEGGECRHSGGEAAEGFEKTPARSEGGFVGHENPLRASNTHSVTKPGI